MNESETIKRNSVDNQISNANQFTSTGSYPISCICILKFKPQALLLRVIFFNSEIEITYNRIQLNQITLNKEQKIRLKEVKCRQNSRFFHRNVMAIHYFSINDKRKENF